MTSLYDPLGFTKETVEWQVHNSFRSYVQLFLSGIFPHVTVMNSLCSVMPRHICLLCAQDTPLSCEPTLLPEPNHVMINHLYALSIKDGVMVISSTQRSGLKTTVLSRGGIRIRKRITFLELLVANICKICWQSNVSTPKTVKRETMLILGKFKIWTYSHLNLNLIYFRRPVIC